MVPRSNTFLNKRVRIEDFRLYSGNVVNKSFNKSFINFCKFIWAHHSGIVFLSKGTWFGCAFIWCSWLRIRHPNLHCLHHRPNHQQIVPQGFQVLVFDSSFLDIYISIIKQIFLLSLTKMSLNIIRSNFVKFLINT